MPSWCVPQVGDSRGDGVGLEAFSARGWRLCQGAHAFLQRGRDGLEIRLDPSSREQLAQMSRISVSDANGTSGQHHRLTSSVQPSASTNSMSLKGNETSTGESIIIPIDIKTLATTMSMIRNGMNTMKAI